MSRVTRDDFVNAKASLDLGDLDAGDKATLAKAGLDPAALTRIAGVDGIISGRAELKELFGLIDKVDGDGSYGSIATTQKDAQGREAATASGDAFTALHNEIAEARLTQDLRGPLAAPLSAANAPADGTATTAERAPKGKTNVEAKPTIDARASTAAGKDAARNALPFDPPWLKTAFREYGVAEGAGDTTNPRILEYFDRTYQKGLHADDSGKKNAWCAAFITFTLAENGIKSGKAVGAREYETWGEASEPFRGAIVVLEHDRQKHVAILAGIDKDGNNVYLGGNQGNKVNATKLPGYEILAIRKPPGYNISDDLKKLPTLAGTGTTTATR